MKASRTVVITIDGPVAAGKTTVARDLAEQLGFTLLDTGAIYRCVALAGKQGGEDWHDESAIGRIAEDLQIEFHLDGQINRVLLSEADVTKAIRRPEISSGASIVSAHPTVRQALLSVQRQYADHDSVVVEGRDTGTVVFPKADLKIFLTAAPETRVMRRFLELREKGVETPIHEVRNDLRIRDERDSDRCVAPLIPAEDAICIDSSPLTRQEVVYQIGQLYAERCSVTHP